ncbi:MAG: YjjG family noncanonical pyrimidine nucleotidase [Bacteroidales bacterium]|nr:YjjG family noncanonical pyrimidine nucleotidase [Bacteroidales bacterium]
MPYTDIFIDLDDTIYDTRNNAQLALKELYEHFHFERYYDSEDDFITPYWEANTELWAQYARGEIGRDYLILERFRRPLSCAHGLIATDDFALEVNAYFLQRSSVKIGIVEGAHELLEYLQHKYKLHLASNGLHEVQHNKMKSAKLDKYFTSVILSEDAGANKPQREFFEYALRTTNCKRENAIMIGDNFNTDIIGAKNAGIDQIYFKRDASLPTPEPVTYEVLSLKEIMAIL